MSSFETCATKKHDHMMHAYPDMECFHRYVLSFQAIFCFFAPLLTPKIKIWKKCKKNLDIWSFNTCTIKPLITIIWCMFPKIWSSTDIFFVILGKFLPFNPLTSWKMKISKMKKTLGISSFDTRVPKIMIICHTVAEIWCKADVIIIFILGYQAFFQALFYNW